MDLKDQVLSMIAAGKKERSAKKRSARKGRNKALVETAVDTPPPVVDPWTRTSVILLTIHTTCAACGSTSVSWEPHLYLEMYRGSRKRGTLCRRIERITSYTGKWLELYAALPKRIEPRLQTSEACPWCLGIEYDNTNGVRCSEPLPEQLPLNLTFGEQDEKLPQDIH